MPVGEDQKQHVELTRDLAERFNNAFGKTFVVPEPMIREEGARVMGLDDPTKKMSKSAGSAYNYIALDDSPDEIRRKIRRAVTDSGTEVRAGPDKPALTNLLTIYVLLAGEPVEVIVRRYEGKGYADFKQDLAEVVVEALAPIQERLRELEADPTYTLSVLEDGAERAEAIAERTMTKVRSHRACCRDRRTCLGRVKADRCASSDVEDARRADMVLLAGSPALARHPTGSHSSGCTPTRCRRPARRRRARRARRGRH